MVWPRGDGMLRVDDPKTKLYRYVIVGMLVTDQPLERCDLNEFLIDGPVEMGQVLEKARRRKPKFPQGEADNVLCNLAIL